MDSLLEMYIEDRNRLNALLMASGQVAHEVFSGRGGPPPPPPPTPVPSSIHYQYHHHPALSATQSKSCLVDKQSSEPTTPTAKTSQITTTTGGAGPERPIIQRGNSDLSQRFAMTKKRVTLRHSLDTSSPSAANRRCGSAGASRLPISDSQRSFARSESSLGYLARPGTTPTIKVCSVSYVYD